MLQIQSRGDELRPAAENVRIREYCAGTLTYETMFPTGTIQIGETIENAADRELQEEIGFGIGRITRLMTVVVFPGHFDHQTHLVIAEDLYEARLCGDEPEELEVVTFPFARLYKLREEGIVREARSMTALLLLENIVRGRLPSLNRS